MAAIDAIIAEGLTRKFGSLVAVDHISMNIRSGEIYGFLGPNGSGKSTTIRMLCGLLKSDEGSVQVLGYSIPRDAEKIRGKIGYMTQQFSLYEDLTVIENLQFISQIFSVPWNKRKKHIDFLLKKYQISDLKKQRTGTLSSGQKQRLALAAVTLHEPPLLLLDEPTSNVDPQSRRDFWGKLFELASEGTTILVSTHYMDEAERCHHLAILDHGQIVSSGSPRELTDGINALVIEIETDAPAHAHQCLKNYAWINSIAQLGTRLHVLSDRTVDDPVEKIQSILNENNISGNINLIHASLEDVFVSATGFKKG